MRTLFFSFLKVNGFTFFLNKNRIEYKNRGKRSSQPGKIKIFLQILISLEKMKCNVVRYTQNHKVLQVSDQLYISWTKENHYEEAEQPPLIWIPR